MIQEIWMRGFESHKDGTEIILDPGVNIFIGDNNHGKSSIIRALNWIVNGEPMGDAYKSADLTEVVLIVDDVEIGKFRDKKTSFAIDEIDLEATRTTPEEIEKLFNMADINWQFQMDSSFLLSETAGFVSKKLNETVNLQIMDQSLKYAKAQLLQLSKEQEQYDSKIEDCDEKLQWLKDNDFEEFGAYVEYLESIQETVEMLEEDQESLTEALDDYQTISEQIKGVRVYDATLIDEIEELDNKRAEALDDYMFLNILINDIENDEKWISEANKELAIALTKEKQMMKGKCALCGK